MSAELERNRAIQELAVEFKRMKGSFMVGAGASIAAKLPSWKQFLQELVSELASLPGVESSLKSSCERMIGDPTKWLMVASILRTNLGGSFTKYIEKRFVNPSLEPSEIHKAIVGFPVKYWITTNYDDLIEAAFSEHTLGKKRIDGISYDNASAAVSHFYRDQQFVLYCHGRARSEPAKVVLSEGDYRNLVQNQIGYQSFLQTLFVSTSFLFVGSSLNDPDFKLLLSFLHSAFHRSTPNQYAIIPDSERELAEISHYREEFNMHLICLPASNYENEVLKFLNDLKAAMEQ